MSQKHALDNKRERERVLETGRFFVINRKELSLSELGIKITENDLIGGVFETTRGLGNHGDKDLKKCVIHTPYFRTYEIDPTIECIIIATEGLWQTLGYDVVVDIVTQVIKNIFL
jgi:serine/threonine protein phosphatase PrpC